VPASAVVEDLDVLKELVVGVAVALKLFSKLGL
jgi:hypothetical protein